MADLIQIARDTAEGWETSNPVLALGQEGYETDTGLRKVGDGDTPWNDLDYDRDRLSGKSAGDIAQYEEDDDGNPVLKPGSDYNGTDPDALPTNATLGSSASDPVPEILASDGAWSWFGGPRAVRFVGDREQTYFGYKDSDNNVVVASYNHDDGSIVSSTLKTDSGGQDDHDVPGLLILPSGKIAAFYSDHGSNPIRMRVSSSAEDVSAFEAEEDISGSGSHTYPFVAQLSGESDRIYLFFVDRDNDRDIFYVYSDDDGSTWSSAQQLIDGRTEFDQGVYYQAYAGSDRIDFIFTGAEGGVDDPKLDVRHAYFQNESLYEADDTDLGGLPVDFDAVPAVYDSGASGNYHAWVWDVVRRGDGVIEAVYAVFPSVHRHQYRYARWDGSSWSDSLLAEAGSYIATPSNALGGSREGYYSPGVALDRGTAGVVYAAIGDNSRAQIHRLDRQENGLWTAHPHTSATPQNIKPVCVENAHADLPILWMRGNYNHYHDWETEIVGGVPAERFADVKVRPTAVTVYLSSGESGVSSGDEISFDGVKLDAKDEADTDNNRIVIKDTGLYRICGGIEVAGDSSSGELGYKVYADDSEITRSSLVYKESDSGARTVGSDIVFLRSGYAVTMEARFGGTFDVQGNSDGTATNLSIVAVDV